MSVQRQPSAELAELNELFNEIGEEETGGILESLGLSFGCCDGRTSEENELPFADSEESELVTDSSATLQSSDEQNNEDEEAVMNFFDDCYCIDGPMLDMDYDPSQAEVIQGAGGEAEIAAGSEAEIAALNGVQNLSLGEQQDWQRLSDEWEAEPGSRTKLQQPLRSKQVGGDTAEAMNIDAAHSSNQRGAPVACHMFPPPELHPSSPAPTTNMFHQAPSNMFKQEPIQTMFKTEPIQTAPPGAPGQPQMLPHVASSVSWFNGGRIAQTYLPMSPSLSPSRDAFSNIDCNGLQRADSKRSRSPTLQVHVKPAAPKQITFSENPLTPPAMTWQASKRTKANAPSGRGLEQIYICGYCDRRKTSTSRCADGRVRIRCQCGGQHKDGKPRMHATWILFGASNSQTSGSRQDNAQEWVFVDDTNKLHEQHQQAAIMSVTDR